MIAREIKNWLIVCATIIFYALPASAQPAAPTNLTATAGNAKITLAWTASSGATSYSVYYGTLPGGEGVTPIGTGITVTTYTDSGLDNGIEYYFKVAAISSSGTSPMSNEASATPSAGTGTEAPYGGTPWAIPGSVYASNYDTGGQGVAYNVTSTNGTANGYRSDGIDLETCTDSPTNGYDLGWTAATQWFRYTVNVATAGAYTVSIRLAAPTAVTGGLHLANSAGTNLSGEVNVPASGSWTTWETVTATVTLPAGQQVLTVDQDVAGWNINYMAFAASGSAPATPTGLTATAGNAQVALSWTASSGATSYNVYRGTTSGGESSTAIATGVTTTTYTNTGLTNGTKYYYEVAALNSSGTSAKSSEVSATPAAAVPAAPTSIGAVAGNTQIALSWTASSGATSYNVYRGTTSGGESSTAIATGITTTAYTNTGLTNGTKYYYELAALNSSGTSAKSTEVSATPANAAPAAPTGLTATAGNAQIILSWTASSGATSYNVYRGTTSGGESSTAIATGITTTTYTNTGLTNGTTYYYEVAALDSSGTSAKSSEVSAAPAASSGAPNFGPNVYIFTPSTPAATIQTDVTNIFNAQQTNQFGTNRYAVLFAPGSYHVDMLVGFYTQVLGLGLTPDATTVSGYINVNAAWNGGNATQNFWRGMENLAVDPSDSNGYSGWAVSQAAPLRRVHVEGDLVLADTSVNPPGWASGGFLGDVRVDDEAEPISQQQMMARNSTWSSWSNAVWNYVFVGDDNAPATSWPTGANTSDADTFTNIAQTPVVREKPFLNVDSSGNYWVFVPALKTNTTGPDWSGSTNGAGTNLSISTFYIAQSTTDNAATINAQLAAGKNILFTPGVYALGGTIQVNNANTVLLGIGLATLQSTNGANAIDIADVGGVTVAGLILEAASDVTGTLLQVGPSGSSASHSSNPTLLADIYTRVGGAVAGSAASTVVINSNNVIGDDFWLWRADHGSDVGWTVNPATNGIIVNGQDFTVYGLAVEHFEQYQTLWNGNGGQMYFYQSEAPYDVPNQSSWMDGSIDGYASYKVANSVTSHDAWGLGIYCYFDVNPAGVVLQNAIESPAVSGVDFTDMMTDSLGGVGTISSVCNGNGIAVTNNDTDTNETSYLPSCN